MEKLLGLTDADIERLGAGASRSIFQIVTESSMVVQAKIRTTITKVVAEQLHVKAGVKELRKAWVKAGLAPKNSFTIEAVYRTQTQLAYAAGRAEYDKKPEIDELIWGYKYVTIGDDRVRDSHIALDGITLPKDDPWWLVNSPPNGWACRCQKLVITKSRRQVQPPESVEVDGKKVTPGADPGFRFDPGSIMSTGSAAA